MLYKQYHFQFQEYASEQELEETDRALLRAARKATRNAYAPYSNFLVGAAALLANNEIVTGSNQENASFPAGMCAERALLASAAQLFPNIAIYTMAVTCDDLRNVSSAPVSPCGFCRQVIAEYEMRVGKKMRLLLGGKTGAVYLIPEASMLLPFNFYREGDNFAAPS